MKPLLVGVLALQGAFAKHIEMLRSLDVRAVEVRKPADLAVCDGLIIPGGESTVLMRQMQFIDLIPRVVEFAKTKPVFGTCAGLILMSQKIINEATSPLQLLDIEVERNAFGRQAESFKTHINVYLGSGKPRAMQVMFIRAPRIRCVAPEVKILAHYQDEAVLVQQGRHMGATFHSELLNDPSIHAYFLKSIQNG